MSSAPEAKPTEQPSDQVSYAVMLEPKVLSFHGPFTSACVAKLQLQNPSDKRLAFKVKTIEPWRYVVKPGKGFLEAKQALQVMVRLRPIGPPKLFNPAKQKFVVQSVVAPNKSGDLLALFRDTPDGNIYVTKFVATFDEENKELNAATKSSASLPSPSKASVRSKSLQSVTSRASMATLKSNPNRAKSESAQSAPAEPTAAPSKPPSAAQAAGTSSETNTSGGLTDGQVNAIIVGVGVLLLALIVISHNSGN